MIMNQMIYKQENDEEMVDGIHDNNVDKRIKHNANDLRSIYRERDREIGR